MGYDELNLSWSDEKVKQALDNVLDHMEAGVLKAHLDCIAQPFERKHESQLSVCIKERDRIKAYIEEWEKSRAKDIRS